MTDEAEQKNDNFTKCPKCGKTLTALVTRCLCGHELSHVQASAVIANLVEKFEQIEAELSQQGLTGSAREKETNRRRARLIRDFPIPNARADLQSLIHFITPKIQDDSKPDPNIDDWRVKFKEVMALAKQAYRDDAKVRAEFEEIERSLTFSLSGAVQSRAKRNPLMVFGVAAVILFVIGSLGYSQYGKWQVSQCEKEYEQGATTEKNRLNALVTQVTTQSGNKDYLNARSSANQVLWNYQGVCKVVESEREKSLWDEKRKELLAQIDTQENADKAQKQAEEDRKAALERAETERKEAAERAEANRIAQEKRAVEAKEAARQRAATDRQMEDGLRQGARDAARRNR